jgi:hypothetical protein
MGNFVNARSVGKPRTIWEDVVRRDTITGPRNKRMEETSKDRKNGGVF